MSLPIFIKCLRQTLFKYSGLRYASTSISFLQDISFQSYLRKEPILKDHLHNEIEEDNILQSFFSQFNIKKQADKIKKLEILPIKESGYKEKMKKLNSNCQMEKKKCNLFPLFARSASFSTSKMQNNEKRQSKKPQNNERKTENIDQTSSKSKKPNSRFKRKDTTIFNLDKKSAEENFEIKEEPKEPQSETNENAKDGQEDKRIKKDKYFSVFVGNLSWDAKEEHIESLFLPYGKPIWISLLKDNETGYSKGAAFVKYKDEKKALASLELNGKVHMGRTLQINMASDKEALEKHKAMVISRTSSTIYVSNLPYKQRDENSFRELFAKCGKIVKVTFPKDEDGKFLHYGFVEFARPQSVKIALGIKNPMYGGRKLKIKYAELKEEDNNDE